MRVWDIAKSIVWPEKTASEPTRVSSDPQARNAIAKVNAGENYRAGLFYHAETVIEDLPRFTRHNAQYMIFDTAVGLGLRIRDAILAGVEVEAEGDADVVEYIEKLWKKIWGHYAHRLLETKQWGYAGWTIDYSVDSDGLLCIEELKGYRYSDVKPLVSRGKVVGFRITRTNEKVIAPNALWTTFDAKHGNHSGNSILRRAYPEWYEKWMKGGSKKTLQLRMLKDAYRGDVVRYPNNEKVQFLDDDGNTIEVAAADVARELAENMRNGSATVAPSDQWPNGGGKKWELEKPWDGRDPTACFRWVESNDEGILKALDILPEVVKAATTGSGFSGRSVPLMMTVQACQVEAQELLQSIDAMVIRPCVEVCFGTDAEYSINLKPLIETLAGDIDGSSMGGGSIGGGPNGGGNDGGGFNSQPPMPMGGRGQPVQFREDQPAGSRWVTIGGRKTGSGERAGGFPVLIDGDGNILRGGPKSMRGTNVSDAGSHFKKKAKERKERESKGDDFDFGANADNRDIGKVPPVSTRLGKTLREAVGDDPRDLTAFSELVDDVWEARRSEIAEENAALDELVGNFVRKHKQGAFTRTLQRAEDPDQVKGFDELVDMAERDFPMLLTPDAGNFGASSPEHMLFERLKRGKLKAPAKHSDEIIEEALAFGDSVSSRDFDPGEFANVQFSESDYKSMLDNDIDDPIQFSEERWITIGQGDEGGTPVKISDDGTIVIGPKALKNRNLKSLGKPSGEQESKPESNPRPKKSRSSKKLTIRQAAKQLAAKGVKLVGSETYDLKNKIARYRVEVDGEEKIVTSSEIKDFLAGEITQFDESSRDSSRSPVDSSSTIADEISERAAAENRKAIKQAQQSIANRFKKKRLTLTYDRSQP